MIVKSLITKENIQKCLSYVDKEYQTGFLDLMQNIEILVSESLPLPMQQGQQNDKKIVGHTYKVTILRTDFKSRAVYSFSYCNYDELNLKTEPDLYKILNSIRTIYNNKSDSPLRQIFTDAETMVLPLISF